MNDIITRQVIINLRGCINVKVSVLERDNKVCYQISDFAPQYERVLKNNHYLKVENRFEKCFLLPFANPDKTKANFLKYAENMFAEEASSKPMRWQEGLRHFAAIAKEAGIDWWTSGRTALALKGVDIEVNDLDFIFYSKDINVINEAFSDYIIEPIVSTEGGPRSNWVKYFGVAYSYCQTCFAVEPHDFVDVPEPVHFGQYAIKNLEIVNWNGYDIKVSSIDLHLKTYERWGKTNVAQKIKDYLHRNY